MKNTRTPPSKRITFLKACFGIFACFIVLRAAQIQIFKDERLAALARRQFNSKVSALPRRGLIFDRNGEGLAISVKGHSLFMRPEIFRKENPVTLRRQILRDISNVTHLPLSTLQDKVASEKGFVWLKRQLSAAEEKSLIEKGALDYGDGLGLAEETRRFYPNKDLAAHVLGTVNVDGNGLEGLELFYENILNGEQQRVASHKDAMGRKIFQDDKGILAFKDGQTLVLTLDKAIQYETEKSLRNAIGTFDAKAGSIIVAEVDSGEILAMANYPTFDLNFPKRAAQDHRRNRAITDTYEPGSTFKPFVVGAALEKGKSIKTKIYCEKGSFTVGDRKISEAETHEKYEWLGYSDILKFSSNIGAAKIALDLGSQGIAQLIEKLGVSSKTGIDLPGEVAGNVDSKQLNSPVRIANIGFGHGIAVTPIQMLTYYLAIANGGHWIQPKLVKAILAEDPDSLERGTIRWKLGHRFDLLKSKKLFSQQTSNLVTAMLETVTQEGGTATRAQLDEWPVAGKTGTAQKIDPLTRKYSRSKYIASFAGFAPTHSPKLVALVVLDEPKRKYYGGETAAPIFAEVMRAALLREKVPAQDQRARTLQLANKTNLEALSSTEKNPQPTKIEINEQGQYHVPDLSGLSVLEIQKLFSGIDLDTEFSGTGLVSDQSPSANSWVQPKTKLKLSFSHPWRSITE